MTVLPTLAELSNPTAPAFCDGASTRRRRRIAVIGAGPAGLMAAQICAGAGASVQVFDRMPSAGRKFLLAGKGGLNLTHSEPIDRFCTRFLCGSPQGMTTLIPLLNRFGPQAIRDWADGLGAATFVGSSGRVFPREMKAAPLLRAWLHRLRANGVEFRMRHHWTGWTNQGGHLRLRFKASTRSTTTPTAPAHQPSPDSASGVVHADADAIILALGGGSWPRLGSDGSWMAMLAAKGVDIAAFRPANCGFDVGWRPGFAERFAGAPLKAVAVSVEQTAPQNWQRGEFVVTQGGIEGSVIYAVASTLRDRLAAGHPTRLWIDLRPDLSEARLVEALARPRGSRSLANHLRARAGIDGVKAGLLREHLDPDAMRDMRRLAAAIKALPLTLAAARPVEEAISSAGGVRFDAIDTGLMLRSLPGVFCAGEMLDWEAPTGGYLLTACFATGRQAALGALAWLQERSPSQSDIDDAAR